MARQSQPIGAIIFFLLIIGSFAFITVQAIRSTLWSVLETIAMLIMFTLTYLFLVGYESIPLLAMPKRFIALDGTIGVCLSALLDESAGQRSIVVGIRKKYAPEFMWERLGVLETVMLKFGGMVRVPVVANANLFMDIPSESCMIPQGCILLMGSIDRDKKIINTVKYPLQYLKELLEEKDTLVRDVYTRMMHAVSQAATNSQTTKKDLIEDLKSITPTFMQLMQAKQPQEPSIRIGTGLGGDRYG